MKTKLLYISSFMLVLFTSCSVEDNNQLSDQEKDLKVKSLVKTFAEEVQPSASYKKIIEEIKLRSQNSSGYTEEELEILEQEFLSQQSEDFVMLYHYVVNLNLSEEELRTFVMEYFSLKNEKSVRMKNDGDDCAFSSAVGSLFFGVLSRLICEVQNEQNGDD
ncbi:hypothetical protein [uncultured Aquimarina sp.]|uniref:hypothetical protein n=1 Tax=uncultured Aquimarina sp. TaxID=575652 RepID=UPI0026183B61|nr:hypothetical protein [uncultured Aquimarina sp.]